MLTHLPQDVKPVQQVAHNAALPHLVQPVKDPTISSTIHNVLLPVHQAPSKIQFPASPVPFHAQLVQTLQPIALHVKVPNIFTRMGVFLLVLMPSMKISIDALPVKIFARPVMMD